MIKTGLVLVLYLGLIQECTIIEKLWNSPGVSEMTVKPHPNSRICLKMCWVFSNLEFT